MTELAYKTMNLLLNKIKLTETTKLDKYRDTELREPGRCPFVVP
jgi:hypothetical protein